MYCTVLYCTVLYCTILYCVIAKQRDLQHHSISFSLTLSFQPSIATMSSWPIVQLRRATYSHALRSPDSAVHVFIARQQSVAVSAVPLFHEPLVKQTPAVAQLASMKQLPHAQQETWGVEVSG